MQSLRNDVNRRLLSVILGISIGLAVLVATIISSEKAWVVRIIDNLFLGALLNLCGMLFFRMRARQEEAVHTETVAKRKKGKLAKEERKKLSRLDTFRLFTRHFGWSSLLLFVLSGLGTILYTLMK